MPLDNNQLVTKILSVINANTTAPAINTNITAPSNDTINYNLDEVLCFLFKYFSL